MARPRKIVDMKVMSVDLRNVEFVEKFYSRSRDEYYIEITFWSKNSKKIYYLYQSDRDREYNRLMKEFVEYTNKHG